MIWSFLSCRFAVLNFLSHNRCIIINIFHFLSGSDKFMIFMFSMLFFFIVLVYLQYEAAWRAGKWDFSLIYVGDNSSSLHVNNDRFNENLHR